MKTSEWLLPLYLAVLGSALPLTGCSSNKNHDERANTPEAQADIDPSHPEIVDVMAQQAARKAECVSTCLPDPGSRPIDCPKALAGYEFVWAWNLEGENKARATYTYDDNTTTFLVPQKDGWEPVPDDIDVCGLRKAVRFKGGPFTEYGGGFGQSFVTATNSRDMLAFVEEDGTRTPLPPSPEFPGDDFAGAYDLSGWEGIAIWVRRGPNGQSTMRVGITERSSAEDLNTGSVEFPERESRYCRRYRLCGCAASTPCTMAEDTLEYCYDPAVDPEPDGINFAPDYCGTTRCDELNTSTTGADPLFSGRSCQNAVQSDGLTARFCYNPGQDPNPPAKRERCGNPFSRPITVGLDWQLIRVPFSELRQSDEAFVADGMDLTSVKQLVVTHTTGWTDFWVANLGFYRKLPDDPVNPL